MIAIILLAGTILDPRVLSPYLGDADFIICADGGAKHLERLNVRTTHVIGDMDSIDPKVMAHIKQDESVQWIWHRKHKDETDSHLAIDFALENGCDDIRLIGAFDDLIDHSLVNLFLLERIVRASKKGCMINERCEVRMVCDELTIKSGRFNRISLIPITEQVTGITSKGLFYPLSGETLLRHESKGASNRMTGQSAQITVKEGLLLVVQSKE